MTDWLALDDVPAGGYEAARWLRVRHRWVDELVGRIETGTQDWLDDLAGAITDCAENAAAWREYERAHPEPFSEGAYVAWLDAGPSNTTRGRTFAVMSSGEQRLVRLVATLCPATRVPWSVAEIEFDERGAAVLADWLVIVRRHCPNGYTRAARSPSISQHAPTRQKGAGHPRRSDEKSPKSRPTAPALDPSSAPARDGQRAPGRTLAGTADRTFVR
jgi:hypothetical protein